MLKMDPARMRDRVYSIEELATLPSAVVRILSITQDPSSTALDLAAEIVKDPVLTMKVLRTVNSSFFGFNRRIQTVSDAVILLGFTEVERIALAISLINLLGGDRDRARGLTQLWRHSLVASISADLITESEEERTPEYAGVHVAALLHDIGKAVIGQYFPEVAAETLRRMEQEEVASFEAEREIMGGISHAEIGAWLADRWSLPLPLVEAILLHHSPEEADDNQPLVGVAHLADVVCYELEVPSLILETRSCIVKAQPVDGLSLGEELLGRVRQRLDRQRNLIGAIAARSL